MMKTKLFVACSLCLSLLTVCGCESNVINSKTKSEVASSKTNSVTYKSIYDYIKDVNNKNLKTNEYKLVKNGNVLHFELNVSINEKLREKMLHTKTPFYFTFAPIIETDTLNNVFDHVAEPIEIKVTKDNSNYVFKQDIETKKTLSKVDETESKRIENYELMILNEEQEVIAHFFDLQVQ
ncbi:hypothetical protein ACFVR2_20020 [Gottfriedia sp. NPDC057991]|uniref:hypothetical protein n=1 Tax=Gottfriedia sp. NPDC057991 TaxID=3346298 RepID=UPI0036D7DF89